MKYRSYEKYFPPGGFLGFSIKACMQPGLQVTISAKADTCMLGQNYGTVPAVVFCIHVINFYRVNNLTYFLKLEDIATKLGQKVVEVSPNISNNFSCR